MSSDPTGYHQHPMVRRPFRDEEATARRSKFRTTPDTSPSDPNHKRPAHEQPSEPVDKGAR